MKKQNLKYVSDPLRGQHFQTLPLTNGVAMRAKMGGCGADFIF